MGTERIWPDYKRFCDIRAQAISSGSCDLSGLERPRPTTILPLIDLLRKTRMQWTAPRDGSLSECIGSAVDGERGDSPNGLILRLPKDPRQLGAAIAIIASQGHGGKEYGGRNAFMYLIGELTHNVYDHSSATDSFIMVQRRAEARFVELSVLDDGITMAESLRRSGVVLEDDVTAIAMAMNGLSSKREGRRGFGLRTNARMCVRGLRGSILAVSGHGALEIGGFGTREGETQDGYRFEDKFYLLEGTLVSVRIPFQDREVDLYDFA